uniref:hypothetical protein n=1 Tax=Acinetobacter tandoii TaxID=202954 RepID=UPI003F495F87
MDQQLFKDLIASINVAGAIRRKKIKASRINQLEWSEIKKSCVKTNNNQTLNDM